MVQEHQSFAQDPVQIRFLEFGSRRARKLQKVVDDVGGPERLLDNLFQKNPLRVTGGDHFSQHLRLRRNHSQRGVDLVSHTGSQHADGRKLFGLCHLVLQPHTVRDVVEKQ